MRAALRGLRTRQGLHVRPSRSQFPATPFPRGAAVPVSHRHKTCGNPGANVDRPFFVPGLPHHCATHCAEEALGLRLGRCSCTPRARSFAADETDYALLGLRGQATSWRLPRKSVLTAQNVFVFKSTGRRTLVFCFSLHNTHIVRVPSNSNAALRATSGASPPVCVYILCALCR